MGLCDFFAVWKNVWLDSNKHRTKDKTCIQKVAERNPKAKKKTTLWEANHQKGNHSENNAGFNLSHKKDKISLCKISSCVIHNYQVRKSNSKRRMAI